MASWTSWRRCALAPAAIRAESCCSSARSAAASSEGGQSAAAASSASVRSPSSVRYSGGGAAGPSPAASRKSKSSMEVEAPPARELALSERLEELEVVCRTPPGNDDAWDTSVAQARSCFFSAPSNATGSVFMISSSSAPTVVPTSSGASLPAAAAAAAADASRSLSDEEEEDWPEEAARTTVLRSVRPEASPPRATRLNARRGVALAAPLLRACAARLRGPADASAARAARETSPQHAAEAEEAAIVETGNTQRNRVRRKNIFGVASSGNQTRRRRPSNFEATKLVRMPNARALLAGSSHRAGAGARV
mmetsp:Transcript_30754/g.76535  ORF Transcript_30754/g.76535 Transcript_30754/m.76535 type:complete len:309 (+) Transcript_30754:594-1520(+)